MVDERGREILVNYATGLDFEFRLAEDSTSWKILRSYLLEKEIWVMP